MSHIIDRRKNLSGKSVPNRQKFIKRVKNQVKKSVKGVIREQSVKDLISDSKKKISVPVKDLNEPHFRHTSGGIVDRVLPGNDKFHAGDRVPKPGGGGGAGGGASDSGEGEDEFSFHLSKEEFLDTFFDDLELPNLTAKQINSTTEYVWKRAGFSVDGAPNNLNVYRSIRQAKARKKALGGRKKKELRELKQEREHLIAFIAEFPDHSDDEQNRLKEVDERIAALKRRLRKIPFIDEIDLRFNRHEKVPNPVTQAVMFCIMDVSGSMGEWEKEMAKRFFILLYLFLVRGYDRIEIVFVRYHTKASVVDEHEFFYSRETGGTVFSPALDLVIEEMKKYPPERWDSYVSHATDGDNWHSDTPVAIDLLNQQLMSKIQYYAYVEIDKRRHDSDLWSHLEEQVKPNWKHFAMAEINDVTDIFPVFRNLFRKK